MDKKRKAYVFAGSPDAKCKKLTPEEDSFIVCADGGYLLAKRNGIRPHAVIGDFDTYKRTVPDDIEVIKYPPEKDDTDTMLAVRLCLERGYNDITIAGGLGARLDHTFANIQVLRYIMKKGAVGRLYDDDQYALLQGPGIKVYDSMEGRVFSAFAFTEECTGVNLKGFKYPLKDGVIKSSFPIGISNKMTGRSGIVSLDSGVLLIIIAEEN